MTVVEYKYKILTSFSHILVKCCGFIKHIYYSFIIYTNLSCIEMPRKNHYVLGVLIVLIVDIAATTLFNFTKIVPTIIASFLSNF